MPTTLGASRVKASLSIDILAVFGIPRTQVIIIKVVSNSMITHKEVLFWEGTVASVEIARRSGFEVINLVSSVIMNRRSILTVKCSIVESPGVLRKRESFQRVGNGFQLENLQVWKEVT
jgi:hypothetical protein